MSNESIIDPNEQPADQELNLRPSHLKEFIGQQHIKDNLSIFIQAAKKRQGTLDHVLFSGPPGLGKTTLAQIVAKELGVNFRATTGPMLTKAGDLAAILTNLQPHDVLFIDEIHRLYISVEEVLYPAMEDFTLDLIIGEGPSARTVRIDVPPFTLVGATTRLGLLSNPLRDRFGIPLHLQFYTSDELGAVIKRGADILGCVMNDEGVAEIAKRSRGTPRIALRLLRRIRDYAEVQDCSCIDAATADTTLTKMGIDIMGLDGTDYRYLNYIAQHYHGGPVGIETIAAGLSEQRDVIEETIEPFLLQQGLIQRTPRGRMLTHQAFHHLQLDPPITGQTTLFNTDEVEF